MSGREPRARTGVRGSRLAPAALLAGVFAGAAALTVSGDQRTPGEYEVKAAFLYNFAKYVEWPAQPLAIEQPAFSIVILGRDPFGSAIDETLQGKTVRDRDVVVRRATRLDEIGECQILFIGDSERGQLAEILDVLEGTPTLTVGDMEDFAERGGVIRFRLDGSRIRLDVNPDAAARAGLRVSSELLKLARIVLPRRGS